jgi:thiol:disulfide interchange protein DsbC
MINKIVAFVLGVALSATAMAKTDLEAAQDKLKATFSKIHVVDFKESPIDNVYEVNMGNGVIYYYPEKELLLFGEMFDKSGMNLTQASLQENALKLMDDLPMDSAIVIGDEDGIPLIEFTDPECPYCRNYERWLSTIADAHKLKRIIYFDNRIHPHASPKIEHIICSENKELAMYNMYHDITPKGGLKKCDKAAGIMADHLKIAQSLGVAGTPSFFMDGKMQTGFRKQPILDYLNK